MLRPMENHPRLASFTLPGENWAPISGHAQFLVSDHGRIWSNRRGKVCKLGKHRQGYWLAVMDKKCRYVHRLVAEAFIPNPLGLPVVNHRDANPANSLVGNLEWTTQKENIRLAMAIRGNWLLAAPRRVVAIWRTDMTTGESVRFNSLRAAADDLNTLTVRAGGIARDTRLLTPNICHARRRQIGAYGFTWSARKPRPAG